uniref:VirQ n=1 Tax=Agrobacterium genomosp. 6 TaxID=1183411 RepID=A0A2Z2PCB8_9HYPH|nr:hypothetical protein [Agrobacterium genomosp. 6]ASK41380.1 hypothetical protein [Agrobacterium genomosp. 6]
MQLNEANMKTSTKKMLVYAAIIFTPGFIYFPLYKYLLTLYSEDSGDTYFCQFYTDFSFFWIMGLLVFALSTMLKKKP